MWRHGGGLRDVPGSCCGSMGESGGGSGGGTGILADEGDAGRVFMLSNVRHYSKLKKVWSAGGGAILSVL